MGNFIRSGGIGKRMLAGDKPTTEAGDAQARIAQQLFSEASPLRKNLLGFYGNMFDGDQFNFSASPVASAAKDTLEQQFGNARDNIIANTASGGALLDRLSDNEMQKAISIGNVTANAADNDISRAIALATGQTGQSLSGIGSAAALQAQQAQAAASQKSGNMQAAGQAAALMALKASDERIKENLRLIGHLYNGLNIYLGNYKGDPQKQLFIIAQEVEKRYPEAVIEINGIKHVNYGAIWQE